MNFRKKIWHYGWLLLFSLLSTIYSSQAHAGNYAAEFLKIGVGARPLAMGGAFAALSNDGTAFYWNPAGLSNVRHIEINFEHVPMFGGLAQYNTASLALKIARNTALGVSWIRLGIDDIPIYPEFENTWGDRVTNPAERSTGEAEGYFTDTENAFMVTFARKIEFEMQLGGGLIPIWVPAELSFGMSYKYIEQRLSTSQSSGQGLDAGALFRIMSNSTAHGAPVRCLGIGINFQDFSKTTMKWNTQSGARDSAELTWKAGIAYSQWINPLQTELTFALDKDNGAADGLYLGCEFLIKRRVALRLGSHDSELTMGAGLFLGAIRIDYAFVGYELKNTHRISATLQL